MTQVSDPGPSWPSCYELTQIRWVYHVDIMPELHRQNAINETKALIKYPYTASSGPNKIIARILS